MGRPRFWMGRPEITDHLQAPPSRLRIDHIWPIRIISTGSYIWDQQCGITFAIIAGRMVFWRVDGLPAILNGSTRNHGPPSTIARGHQPDPNRGKVLTRLCQFHTAQSTPLNGSRIRRRYSQIGYKRGSNGESMGCPRFGQGRP